MPPLLDDWPEVGACVGAGVEVLGGVTLPLVPGDAIGVLLELLDDG